MRRTILTIITALALTFMPASILSSTASAACPASTSSRAQVLNGAGQTGNCDDSGVSNILGTAVGILSIVVGIAAIIMIIYSGFKYITSAGDSAKVSSAKNTLIYALVGVVIVVLAQLMVRFVITQSEAAATNKCATNIKIDADDPKCKP